MTALEAMGRINQAWMEGRVDDLRPVMHPDITMVFPGFSGRVQGREELLAGFRDFLTHAKIHEFSEHDHEADTTGNVAVVTFRYEMVYERSNKRYRSTGRDLWVLENQRGDWIAVWRAMVEMQERSL